MFKRAITSNELESFLKICHSIQLTIKLLKKLDEMYKNEKIADIKL
jgi:hypothetical protein